MTDDTPLRHPGRRHADTVAHKTAEFIDKWGPKLAVIVSLGALGSCAMVTASALGFAPSRSFAGTRIGAVEIRLDSLAHKQDTLAAHQVVTQAAISDLVLLRCGDDNLNPTQRRICARWDVRREP